jgi:hypothetical protein
MPKLNLITPPDKLFNDCVSFLLIYPTDDIKDDLQEVIKSQKDDVNVYVYSPEDAEQDATWLLSVVNLVDYVIFNVDDCSPEVRKLASYIISKSNTYWLTKEANPVYNVLSVKQIYTLDFLKQEGLTSE